MFRVRIGEVLSALALASLACGPLGDIAKGALGGESDMTTVASLWSDVPAMEGMAAAQQVDMPVWLKALARPIMDTMMTGLNDGNEAGHWDWTAFTLSGGLPVDVQAFYTPERMAGYGWKQGEQACLPMAEQALLCSFTKEEAGQETGLIVIAATDEQKKETSVFFLRAEGIGGGPAAGEPTATSGPLSLSPIAPITIGQDLTAIDLCVAIPQEDMEAVLGRDLVKAPERFDYYETPGASGCSYDAGKDSSGEAHYGYVVLTPVDVYANQPLYQNIEVTGIGDEAYFNNGADTRQLWVRVDDAVAFVVAFGDIANEDYERAVAELLVAAISQD
jgi:hypothetical protein